MSDDLFDLEKEVRDLAARRDIDAAICAYSRSHDRLLPDQHELASHPGAHVDCGGVAGTAAEFLEYAQSFLKQIKSSHHLLGQFDIKVNGDTAEGEVYFLAQHRIVEEGVEKDMFVTGRYIDRCYGVGDRPQWRRLLLGILCLEGRNHQLESRRRARVAASRRISRELFC
jgi:SnoaL-like domain